ncbi:hypothetical protein JCM1393_12980 [Clostridium carnis]
MFRDLKSTGFNFESTWSNHVHYTKMLYFCVYIAYCYIISLGVSCAKDKKINLLNATKILTKKKLEFTAYLLQTLNHLKDNNPAGRNII